MCRGLTRLLIDTIDSACAQLMYLPYVQYLGALFCLSIKHDGTKLTKSHILMNLEIQTLLIKINV